MKRKLTIRFHRAVTDPRNENLEVVITPLASASHPGNDQTILGLKQVRKVRLFDPITTVVFELVPSYAVGLSNPILYRISWRRGSFGRIESHEFAMPDQDIDFDDLADLGNIVTGEEYLKEEDLGTPGRVAQLNDEGQVVDSEGNALVAGEAAEVRALLDAEIVARETGDTSVKTTLRGEFTTRVDALERKHTNELGTLEEQLQGRISTETRNRSDADEATRTTIEGVQRSVTTTAQTLRSEFATADLALDKRKADLIDGKLPANQLPDIALGTAVPVANQSEMIALTSAQVQPGDLAIRPDGTFMLVEPTPDAPGSWRRITAASSVVSVNGNVGAVTLSYNDVGARPSGAPIPMNDILGLDSALANMISGSQLSTLSARVDTEAGKLTTLVGRVDGMQNAWSRAVLDARDHALTAADYADSAARTADRLSFAEGAVISVRNDIQELSDGVSERVTEFEGTADQVRADVDLNADLVSVAVTAANLLEELFNAPTVVRSINGISPDSTGNVVVESAGGLILGTMREHPSYSGMYYEVPELEWVESIEHQGMYYEAPVTKWVESSDIPGMYFVNKGV